jgi:hypothetical protein
MTWGEFKKAVDEHIEDKQELRYIDVAACNFKWLDFDWNEDCTVDIST